MDVFRHFRRKEARKSAPAETRSCSHNAAINGLATEIRTLTARIDALQCAFTARIDGLQRAVTALNAFRVALEAKTWIAFHQRRSGRVAGGCARAARAKRDARGRYLPDLRR